MSSERRVSWDAGFWVAAVVALVAACLALARGIAPSRAEPTSAFVALWFGAASYALVAKWGSRRRAARLRTAQIPRGVLLARPIWIPLQETFAVVAVGAAAGAGAALVGFPWVGVGILLALGALGLVMIAPLSADLTFEASGLRIHLGRGQCLLPWTAVLDVGIGGPARAPSVNVRVADPGLLYASVTPDTRKAKSDLYVLLQLGNPGGQALRFGNWSAGLDAATLARAVREATGASSTAKVN